MSAGIIEQVSLSNLGHGAAVEIFDHELIRVLENIQDPNTKPDAVREITLKVKIKPDKARDFGIVEAQVVSKLAPVNPFTTRLFIGHDGEKPTCQEHDPHQLTVKGAIEQARAGSDEEDGNVTSIDKARGARKGE